MRLLTTLIVSLAIAGAAHAAVTGTILTAEGKAVAGASVRLLKLRPACQRISETIARKADLEPLASTTSRPSGDFKLEVPKSGNYELLISAAGFAPDRRLTTGFEELGGMGLRAAPDRQLSVTAGGKAIAGAVVIATSEAGSRLVVVTDEAGHVKLPEPSMWKPRIRISHPDFAPLKSTQLQSDTPQFSFRLNAGITLRGKVLEADGKSGAKASLTIDGFPAGESVDDGSFVLQHVRTDWKELIATTDRSIAVGRPGALTLRLARGIALSGSVVEAKTHRALGGALVAFSGTSPADLPEDETTSVTADEKGRFNFPLLPAGNVILAAHYAGYTAGIQPATIRAGAAPLQLSLQRMIRVSGRVVDEERKPLAAATMSVHDPRGYSWGGDAGHDGLVLSASDGRFVFAYDARDSYFELQAKRSGYAPAKEGPLRLHAGEEKSGLLLTLHRGVALRGKIIGPDDQPVSGALIDTKELLRGISYSNPYVGNWKDAEKSAADGSFNLRLQPGTYELFVRAAGFATAVRHQLLVSAALPPVIVKLEPGAIIAGRVVDQDNAPVPQLTVFATDDAGWQKGVTDESGTFRLEGLPARSISLDISNDDESISETREVKAPAENVVIRLSPSIRISGRVIDKGSGSPLTDFDVIISPQEEAQGNYFFPSRSISVHDAAGEFSIPGVVVRPTELRVRAAGYQTAKHTLELKSGKPLEGLEVALEKGAVLSGRIIDEEGDGVGKAYVSFEASDAGSGSGDEVAVSDNDGAFELAAIAHDTKGFLVARRQGYRTARKAISVADHDVHVELQLSRGLLLIGHVVDPDGAPVQVAEVQASSQASDAQFDQVTTDARGEFRFEGMAPGRYTVLASRRGYASKKAENIDPAQSTDLTLQLEPGATIRGHVSGFDPSLSNLVRITARGKETAFGYLEPVATIASTAWQQDR